MTIEEAEAKIEALADKVEALGDVVDTLVEIITDNLQHRKNGEVQRDLANYHATPNGF